MDLITVIARRHIVAAGKTHNIATTPLNEATEFAAEVFAAYGQDLHEVLPNFKQNYLTLQAACGKALDYPRIDMPVIEPNDIGGFMAAIEAGRIDIFQPYARGHLPVPRDLKPGDSADQWLELGFKDGDLKDDVIPAKIGRIPARELLPSQSQIWLSHICLIIAKFGVPRQGSKTTEMTLIVSKEGYILDGHHRYGQAMLANPDLAMSSLQIPIDIKTLVDVGRTYGNAIGNEQKA